MDVTVGDYRVLGRKIQKISTGIIKDINDWIPASSLSSMSYDKALTKCIIAFDTGVWPMSTHRCGFCRSYTYTY